ncbi:hypothetical protein D3C84_831210 [compost metagenome]
MLQLIQGLAAVGGDNHLAAEFSEHALGHQLIDRIILHQQHPSAPLGSERLQSRIVDDVDFRLQDSPQCLVKRITCQRPRLLL